MKLKGMIISLGLILGIIGIGSKLIPKTDTEETKETKSAEGCGCNKGNGKIKVY